MDPGVFSSPSRNMNLHYCDPNHCVTLTCEQAIVFDICESLLPTWAYCPLSEVYSIFSVGKITLTNRDSIALSP